MSTRVSAVGERALIERLERRVGAPPAWIPIGIGDDAAVVEPPRGALDVVTTDCLVEDVHFRRAWTPLTAVGHKALAVNLSDLAAMGAAPRASLLSLILPPALELALFDQLVDGFVSLAERSGAPLVGGNIARSPAGLVVDATVLGSAHRRRLLTRGGGRPGDLLHLTGSVGAAAAGLAMLTAGVGRAGLDEDRLACLHQFERPEARLRCGGLVARARAASACIDLSDGLADAARQIARASRTGVVLDAQAVPVHPGAVAWAEDTGQDPVAFALAGAEDYEILFAVPPRFQSRFRAATRRCGLAITAVGRLTDEPGAWLSRDGRLEPLGEGFRHF
jgi:thiamine-monophosphate kinase